MSQNKDSREKKLITASIPSSLYLVERVTGHMWVQVPPRGLLQYICLMPPKVKKSAEYYAENPESKAKKAEYDTAFNATPEQTEKRVLRNRLRRFCMKMGRCKKGDGNDVHHTGGTKPGNVEVMPASKNRAIK